MRELNGATKASLQFDYFTTQVVIGQREVLEFANAVALV
jgi:hypothetical protein